MAIRPSFVIALVLATTVWANILTTIVPSCSGVPNATITSQYQTITACASGSQITPRISTWVSTTIPCWGHSGPSSCTVTTIDQAVPCYATATTITHTKPVFPRVGWNHSHSRPQTTWHETISNHYYAPFNRVGPWVIPGFGGCELCTDCAPNANGSSYQTMEVIQCNVAPTKTACSTRVDTWVSKPIPLTTSVATATISGYTSCPSAGTYTFTVAQIAPATTLTSEEHVYTIPAQPWDAIHSTSVPGPTVLHFTATITQTVTFQVPESTAIFNVDPSGNNGWVGHWAWNGGSNGAENGQGWGGGQDWMKPTPGQIPSAFRSTGGWNIWLTASTTLMTSTTTTDVSTSISSVWSSSSSFVTGGSTTATTTGVPTSTRTTATTSSANSSRRTKSSRYASTGSSTGTAPTSSSSSANRSTTSKSSRYTSNGGSTRTTITSTFSLTSVTVGSTSLIVSGTPTGITSSHSSHSTTNSSRPSSAVSTSTRLSTTTIISSATTSIGSTGIGPPGTLSSSAIPTSSSSLSTRSSSPSTTTSSRTSSSLTTTISSSSFSTTGSSLRTTTSSSLSTTTSSSITTVATSSSTDLESSSLSSSSSSSTIESSSTEASSTTAASSSSSTTETSSITSSSSSSTTESSLTTTASSSSATSESSSLTSSSSSSTTITTVSSQLTTTTTTSTTSATPSTTNLTVQRLIDELGNYVGRNDQGIMYANAGAAKDPAYFLILDDGHMQAFYWNNAHTQLTQAWVYSPDDPKRTDWAFVSRAAKPIEGAYDTLNGKLAHTDYLGGFSDWMCRDRYTDLHFVLERIPDYPCTNTTFTIIEEEIEVPLPIAIAR